LEDWWFGNTNQLIKTKMSKIKNTPEFQKMIDDQELSASFHYEAEEAERTALLGELAKLEAVAQIRIAYDKAVRELDIAMDNYADAVTNLHEILDEKE
jgi:hypothetical protein